MRRRNRQRRRIWSATSSDLSTIASPTLASATLALDDHGVSRLSSYEGCLIALVPSVNSGEVEPDVIEPVGLEDRTAEVLHVLEEQRASVLCVTGTYGVGKSTLGMRVGQVMAGQLREPFCEVDPGHEPPAPWFAQQVGQVLGNSSPGAVESRGVLHLDNVDAALTGGGFLAGVLACGLRQLSQARDHRGS